MGPPERRRFLVAYGLWIFVVAAYFLPGATWNPASRFALTRAIVENHTLAIDGFEESTGDRAHKEGHWYTDKTPLPSLLAVPVYGVARLAGNAPHFDPPDSAARIHVDRSFQLGLWACSLGTSGLAAALLAVVLFEVLRTRTSPAGALVASSVTVLATPIFPYATSFYGHGIAALLLFTAAAIAAKEEPTRREVRVAGACIALAVGCEYLVAVPALVVAGWIVHGRARTALVDLAAGAAVPAIVIGAYHTMCFGAPWRTGYSYLVRPAFVAGHAGGFLGIHTPKLVALAGLLFGPRRGLFLIAPVALAGVAGLVHAARSGDRASRIALATSAAMLLANSGYYMWWGGAAAGPRHLVPVLPLLAHGFAAVWRAPRFRAPLAGLAIVSFALVLALTAVGLEAPERGNVLTTYVWPNLVRGHLAQIPGASNLGLLAGLPGLASLAPLLAWIALGFAWLVRRAKRLPSS